MRVLMVLDYLGARNPSGAGRYALETARALAGLGHEVRLVAGAGAEEPETDASGGRLPVARFPYPADRGGLGRAGWLLTGGWRAIGAACRRAAEALRPTHLVLHQPLSGAAALRALPALPSTYVFHSPWGGELEIEGAGPLQRRPRAWMERRVIAQCGRVVVLSEFMGGELRHAHPGMALRVRRIGGGVDLARFTFRVPQARAEARVVTVRRLVPRMGLEALIEAMEGQHAVLEIAGRGPLEEALRKRISDFGLERSVRLVGYVPDERLPEFLGEADLFVLPSAALEGFGMVIAEAMACGTPVLGTPVGAIPEVLGAFDPAFVVPDLERALCDTLADRERLLRIRPACRAHAERHFAWKRAGAELAEWLETP